MLVVRQQSGSLMGSNTHGVKPTFKVQRYDRKEKKHINVKCPQAQFCEAQKATINVWAALTSAICFWLYIGTE